ncbi:alpha/beta hydrolase [Robertkochia flava]|uniref:alpha/beta hydrolase n=1 Tax=Robertkochia flava TaxID=3447986 RepID=UPI001CCD17AA|nr:alpha/beta hydrolase-fold protein [Robertkochia marina]
MDRYCRWLFNAFLFLVTTIVSGQDTIPERIGRETLSFAHVDEVYSQILQENRRIWVHLPANYLMGYDRGMQYPVLFILDASSHFTAMAAMASQLGEEMFWPKMIVIGIESTDRMRDLTPSRIHRLEDMPETYLKNTGGASDFLKFITEELIPYVENHYPATSYRSLLGHSLGGLFTTYAMHTANQAFRNYIAIDPSYWWDNNYLIKQLDPYKNCPLNTDTEFYLAAANTLPEGTDLMAVENDRSNRTAHFRAITAYAEYLEKNGCGKDQFHYRFYQDNSHANISIPAFYDAFSRIFDFYNIDPVLKQFDPEILHNISTQRFLRAFRNHYKNISRELGYEVLPEEDLISSMGYRSLELEDFEKAEALFRFNITNFPESSRAYDSMGDFFLATDRPYHAEKYYLKAVTLDRNPISMQKLHFLKRKQ